MADENIDAEVRPYILLTLVRHGETPENKSDIFQGHMDTVLSEEGIKQTQLVGIKLQDENFSHVFSSDLTRARKTAEAIVKKSHFCSHIKIVEDSGLRERCYGVAEGCSKEQFRKMATQSNSKPSKFVPKGAETLDEVRQRVKECFNSIIHEIGSSHLSLACEGQSDICVAHQVKNGFLSTQDKVKKDCRQPCLANVLIVSHGGVLRQLLNYFFDEVASEFPVGSRRKLELVSPNTGVSKLEIFLNVQTNLPEFVKCTCLHNAEHLKEV